MQRKALLSAGALSALLLTTMLTVAPAHAETTQPVPPDVPAPEVSVQYLPYEEPEIQPSPGERVTVTSIPGEVTTYYGVTLACTESITAYNPFKSGDTALASVQFSRSTGCSGSMRANAFLSAQLGLFGTWNDQDARNTTVNPGVTLSLTVSEVCANGNATNWRSQGLYGNATGVPTTSGVVSLACGG